MKKILLLTLLIVFFKVNAQHSGYYTVNQNVNTNIQENVNISGNVNVNKNISTIDYGQLALANAQIEKTRLENLKYVDAKQKQISLEIATDPTKAYDYGFQNTFEVKGKDAKPFGFKKFKMSYRIPHNTLFVNAGAGRFENVSTNNITTEFIISNPLYNQKKDTIDVEKIAKMDSTFVGQLNKEGGNEYFVHKKDISRATIYGIKGFKYSLVWEDDYQYTITDNFISFDPSEKNGVLYFVKVRTYGDKDEVTFEDLEGRRYYLRRLIEKIISTAQVGEMKY